VEAAAPRYQAKDVTLRFDTAQPVTAVVDAVRLQQVLANLLDNALRHTPTGGTVRVGARREREEAVIDVTDTGDGIAPADLDAVFDRFHRIDTARARADGGSGLGLTIARAIVTAHGGTLTASSAGPGTGAAFTIRIPAGAPRPTPLPLLGTGPERDDTSTLPGQRRYARKVVPMIRYIVAAPVVLFLALLLVGALTRRVRVKSCCAVADPTHDTRMTPSGRAVGHGSGSSP
jgi:hypothetical protein